MKPVVLLARGEVLRRLGISKQTLHLLIESDQFPRGRPLNPHAHFPTLRWREDEITAWIDALQPGRGRGRGPCESAARHKLAQAAAPAASPIGDSIAKPLTRAERLKLVEGLRKRRHALRINGM